MMEEAIARMRNIMADFLPPMLESYGLSTRFYGMESSSQNE
jgi:hypothetical protein